MTRAVLIAAPPRELQGKKSSLTRNFFLVPTAASVFRAKAWRATTLVKCKAAAFFSRTPESLLTSQVDIPEE